MSIDFDPPMVSCQTSMPPNLTTMTDPGWFSGVPTDITFHCADNEILFAARIRKAIAGIEVCRGSPDRVIEARDAIALPGVPAIWGSDGFRIPESCVRRGPKLTQYFRSGEENIRPPEDLELVDEPSVYLSMLPAAWGHFLTEGLSRLWISRERAEFRKLRFFYTFGSAKHPHFESFLSYLDIGCERLVEIKKPTRFKTCLIPLPSFSIRGQAYTIHGDTIRTAAGRVVEGSTFDDQPVYLSRSKLRRGRIIRNEQILEAQLAEAGILVIYPELLGLDDQIRLFNTNRIFIGCWGSAFHNLAFCLDSAKLNTHILCESVPNPNYLMFDAILSGKANYIQTLMPRSDAPQIYPNLDSAIDVDRTVAYLRAAGLMRRQLVSLYDPSSVKRPMDDVTTNLQPARESVRRLNLLAERLPVTSYLEIGVREGSTFLHISAEQKTGVDPKFQFDHLSAATSNIIFAEMTSDAFFSGLPIETKYDLIFIDGLHTFEQVVRDFLNSLAHSHDKTVWLIDDTKPCDVYSALDTISHAMKYRRQEAHSQDRSWHGDVYKIVFLLNDFFLNMNYRTLIGSGNPQTLVWKSPNKAVSGHVARFGNLEGISRLDYFAMLENVALLRECSEMEAIELCVRELSREQSKPSI